MIVLHHELAHFYRGHLSYLQHHRGDLKLKEVDDSPAQLTSDAIDLRRLLEFDADNAGGALYGVTMREFDHPVPGPVEGKNERFFAMTIAAAASMFILFEENSVSKQYYPPAWRIQHFWDGFIGEFFAKPISNKDREYCLEIIFSVMRHFEARYADLGWGSEFNMGAAVAQTEIFFEKDIPGRAELAKELKSYMPHLWPRERKHNR